jgi:hypothetical protein
MLSLRFFLTLETMRDKGTEIGERADVSVCSLHRSSRRDIRWGVYSLCREIRASASAVV